MRNKLIILFQSMWKFGEFSLKEKQQFIWFKKVDSLKSLKSCLPWICGAFGLYPWQSELIRPFVVGVGWTDAFEMGAVGIEVSDGAVFRRIVSRSRKWLENDESKNGRWPMPNVRNGWPPFGPKNHCHHRKSKKARSKIVVFKTMYYSYLPTGDTVNK